jgi:hypothetical protein
MMTKTRYAIFYLTVLALLTLLFNSCNPLYTTMEQRLAQFESDLNNDTGRTEIYKNLHPSIADAWKDNAVWIGIFDINDAPYHFNNEVYTDSKITGTWSNKIFSDDDFVCEMAEYGTEGWFITSFSSNGSLIIH